MNSSAGATAEEETAELLLPVNDAGGGLTAGAASAAAIPSLRVSARASRALLAAACWTRTVDPVSASAERKRRGRSNVF
jgi:hypothetical protein